MKFSLWLESLTNQISYHGTNQLVRDFRSEFFGQRDWGDFGTGIYLTQSQQLAKHYAYAAVKSSGGKPFVLCVRMNVVNVANFDDPVFVQQVSAATKVLFPKMLIAGQPQTRPQAEAQAITKYVVSQGFDSATGRNGKEIVVYDPNKLKITGYYDEEDNWNEIY